MKIKTALDQFYYELTINELKLMSKVSLGEKVTYNSLLYLDIIELKENCTVSYLAETLNVAKSAVTLKVKELEKQGLLEKTQSETDKRTFYLSVRPEIAELYKDYDTAFYNGTKAIEDKYTKEEKALFAEMLKEFTDNFMESVAREV